LDEAEAVLSALIPRASRLDMRGIVALAKHNLGMVLAWAGRLEDGKRIEEEAASESFALRDFRVEAGARAYLARMHAMSGDLDAAERDAERGLAIAPASLRGYLCAIRGQLYLARGDAKEALREVERRLEGISGTEEGDVLMSLVHAAALDRLGRSDEAGQVLHAAHARLLARAERIPDAGMRNKFLTVIPEHAKLTQLVS
jgi:tetratricopeptide (TPR) repeat protein